MELVKFLVVSIFMLLLFAVPAGKKSTHKKAPPVNVSPPADTTSVPVKEEPQDEVSTIE
jgi:hypothetical protein